MVALTRQTLAAHIASGLCEVGAYTYGTPEIFPTWYAAKVTIGRYCSIADGVLIFSGGNHNIDSVSTFPFQAFEATFPSATGERITPLPGKPVSIGHGAVIAARAVVARDVPPYGIAAGNPARHVGSRFTEAQIERLLAIAWWDWPKAKIDQEMPGLLRDPIDAFIARHDPR